MTMTVATALKTIGIEERDGEQAVLVTIDGQAVTNYAAQELAEFSPSDQPSLYVASGVFHVGTVSRYKGRSSANVARVIYLPFDCDLASFLDFPRDPASKTFRDAELQTLWSLPDDELNAHLAHLQTDVTEVFDRMGLPIHRLDVTGYGLCAYVYLDEADQSRVDDARAAHKLLIAKINEIAGYQMADVEVSDAGSRITRLPGSVNRKGPTPRVVRTLLFPGGSMPLGDAPHQTQRPAATFIPREGPGLSVSDQQVIVDALKPSWQHGFKHALAMAIPGMLAKAGVPEAQASDMILAISDDGDRRQEREIGVQSSYQRVRTGLDVQGFTALRGLIPTGPLAAVDQVLGRYRQATQRPTIAKGTTLTSVAARKKSDDLNPPERVERYVEQHLKPPPMSVYYGWFGQYREVMAPTTEAPDQYHLTAALVFAGATVGRRIAADYAGNRLYPNLYASLIGRSNSTRKDTAINRAFDLPAYYSAIDQRMVQSPFAVRGNVSSAEGIVKIMSEFPNLVLNIKELSTLLKNAHRKGTNTIIDSLIEAWDTPLTLENNSKLNGAQARNPVLSIIAATQPGRIARDMTSEEIESGFANRWLFVFGAAKGRMARPPKVDKRAAYGLYLNLYDAVYSYPEGTLLDFGSDAVDRWDRWYDDAQNSMEASDDEDDADMRGRHAPIILKIALLFAVAEKAKAIELRHLEPAITFVEWTWSCVKSVIREWGSSSDIQLEEKILGSLKKRGSMKRRDLQRLCSGRRWSAKDFSWVLKSMIDNETIAIDPVTGYVAIASDDP